MKKELKKDLDISLTIIFVGFFAVLLVGILIFVILFFVPFNSVKTGVELADKKYVLYDDMLERVGDYDDAYYQVNKLSLGIFETDSSVLILDYSQEEYSSQVDKINREYIFVSDVETDGYCDVVKVEGEFDIGGWHFKACYSDGLQIFMYPKQFRIIGFNERKKKIAYLDLDDSDLDVMTSPMSAFIDEYFKYDFK